MSSKKADMSKIDPEVRKYIALENAVRSHIQGLRNVLINLSVEERRRLIKDIEAFLVDFEKPLSGMILD